MTVLTKYWRGIKIWKQKQKINEMPETSLVKLARFSYEYRNDVIQLVRFGWVFFRRESILSFWLKYVNSILIHDVWMCRCLIVWMSKRLKCVIWYHCCSLCVFLNIKSKWSKITQRNQAANGFSVIVAFYTWKKLVLSIYLENVDFIHIFGYLMLHIFC